MAASTFSLISPGTLSKRSPIDFLPNWMLIQMTIAATPRAAAESACVQPVEKADFVGRQYAEKAEKHHQRGPTSVEKCRASASRTA